MLKGYKTYITAGVTVIGALASYLVGDISLVAAIQIIVPAILAACMRSGISTEVQKAQQDVQIATQVRADVAAGAGRVAPGATAVPVTAPAGGGAGGSSLYADDGFERK